MPSEHLELDPVLHAAVRAQDEAVGDVEQVVAGDPEVNGARVLGAAAVLDHALVVGVDLDLGRVRRLRPAVERGVDPLHGEVGALDDAHLDRRPAAADALGGPGGEGLLHRERLGQVRLEHDAGREVVELRLAEDLAERGDGQVEVAVLLHVQVDELRRAAPVGVPVLVAERVPVQGAQPLLHALDGVAERDQVDLAEHRGHLDRDVLDVLAREQREVGVEAARRLALAEDRLAELVEVQADPRLAPRGQVVAQLLLLAGQDQRLGLVAQAAHDRRDDHAREVVRHDAAEHEGGALPPVHVARGAVALEQVGELIGDALGPPAAERLVDQRDRQLLAVRVVHQARELASLGALLRGLAGLGVPQQRLGEGDGAVGGVLAGERRAPHFWPGGTE
jgi:hypothetical protein